MKQLLFVAFAAVFFAAPALAQRPDAASSMEKAVIAAGSVAVSGIDFEAGTAALRAGSGHALGEIAALLNMHDEWRFEVRVRSAGARAADLALSEQRAKAVVDWLTGHGIEPSRLVPTGDTKPLAGRAGADGRVTNTRVELRKLNEE